MNDFLYDVFISYSHKDTAWVHGTLLHRLELEKLNVCIDHRDFVVGMPSIVNMEQAFKLSRKILLVLTPQWVESQWSTFESLLFQTDDPTNRDLRIIPLLLQACELPPRLKMLTHLDITSPAKFEDNMPRLVRAIRAGGLLSINKSHVADQDEKLSSPIISVPAPSLDELWSGGMEITIQGDVYLLHDPVEELKAPDGSYVRRQAKAQMLATNRIVWLKQARLLRPTSAAKAQREALEKECRLLERLEQQRNFPRLLNTYSGSDCFTLAHAFPHGRPLTQVFGPSGKPLDKYLTRMLLESMPSLCAMLAILHREHCTHRMLTPENIFLLNGQHRIAVLRDMGLATFRSEFGEGPQRYQAPEQIRSHKHHAIAGPQTDVYQLGVILYHILTGQLPSSPWQIVAPSTWNTALPQELDPILLRAIASSMQERWSRIQEFASELKKVADQM